MLFERVIEDKLHIVIAKEDFSVSKVIFTVKKIFSNNLEFVTPLTPNYVVFKDNQSYILYHLIFLKQSNFFDVKIKYFRRLFDLYGAPLIQRIVKNMLYWFSINYETQNILQFYNSKPVFSGQLVEIVDHKIYYQGNYIGSNSFVKNGKMFYNPLSENIWVLFNDDKVSFFNFKNCFSRNCIQTYKFYIGGQK